MDQIKVDAKSAFSAYAVAHYARRVFYSGASVVK
jgi:hypothetical protein